MLAHPHRVRGWVMSVLLCASLLSITRVHSSCPEDPPAQADKVAWGLPVLCPDVPLCKTAGVGRQSSRVGSPATRAMGYGEGRERAKLLEPRQAGAPQTGYPAPGFCCHIKGKRLRTIVAKLS